VYNIRNIKWVWSVVDIIRNIRQLIMEEERLMLRTNIYSIKEEGNIVRTNCKKEIWAVDSSEEYYTEEMR